MTTRIQVVDDRLVAFLSGDLDSAASPEAEKALQPLLQSGGKDIVIDCTELDYIASSGLRIFLSILKQAKEVGSRVILKNVNDVVRDVLDLTGFVSIFEFE